MTDPKWTRLVPVRDKIVPLLANALVGEALLDKLSAGEVISPAHYDELLSHSQEPSRSREDVARKLLKILMRRPSPCFESFCAVLKEEDDVDRKAMYELLVTYENPRTRALGTVKEDSSTCNPQKTLDCIAPTTGVAQTRESPESGRVSHSPAHQAHGGKCSDEDSSDPQASSKTAHSRIPTMLFIYVHESLRDEWEPNCESYIDIVETYCTAALPEEKILVRCKYVSKMMTFSPMRKLDCYIPINKEECLLRIVFPKTAPEVFKECRSRLFGLMSNLLSIEKIEIKSGSCIVDLTVTGKGFINFICGLHASNFAHLILFDSLAKLQIGSLPPVKLVAFLRSGQLQSVSEAFSVLGKNRICFRPSKSQFFAAVDDVEHCLADVQEKVRKAAKKVNNTEQCDKHTVPFLANKIEQLKPQVYYLKNKHSTIQKLIDTVREQQMEANARLKASQIVEGIPPLKPSHNQLAYRKNLHRYLIRSSLRDCVIKGNVVGDYKKRVEAELTGANYGKKFQALLHVEELQMEVDIRHYDIENAKLIPTLEYLILKVPGLAENRPSVLRGDPLYVSSPGSMIIYQGFVHEVRQEEVALCFASRFHQSFVPGDKVFDVRFTLNRYPLRLQHRAVEILLEDKVACQQLVFPTQRTIAKRVPLCRIEKVQLFDQKVGRDPEQYLAVQHILAGSSRPAPYLIFGPPGTGKTVTTVEAIKQVWRKISGSRILACSPSNSVADDLACRLLSHIPYTEVLRLNAYSRHPKSIDPLVRDEIMKISKCDEDSNNFLFPPLKVLEKYRIIVVTLITAGRLVSASFSRNHFTHVFIDESGNAIEPECIIPVAGLLNVYNPRGGQLVLAGDPKQLGPTLRSPISIENGLQLSLLERLTERCEVYQEPFDPRVATKLVQNYRSHPDILALPNRLFYDGDLKAMADELARSSLCEWGHLPKKGFPIIFHGIEGEDEREERSPSFFNRAEASQVAKYVEMLRDTRGIHIMLGEIGVISPYRKQVQKIRTLLHGKHIASVKVGSVEEFQGSERRIIIISTVRSSKDFLEMDEKYSLGFLKNPKRFNVAITRAKALLIIIGNPYLLSMDEYWNELLEYCRSNGGYTGCYYMPRSLRDDDLHRIRDLHLDRDHVYTAAEDLASTETGGVSLRTEQEDPEWREGE